MKLSVGQIVKGNKNAGLAKYDIGVVISTSMSPPRTVNVKFLKQGYWLIKPNELCEPLPSDIAFLPSDFVKNTIDDSKPIPPRSELINLLGEALNHIDDNDLNRRISEALARNEI